VQGVPGKEGQTLLTAKHVSRGHYRIAVNRMGRTKNHRRRVRPVSSIRGFLNGFGRSHSVANYAANGDNATL